MIALIIVPLLVGVTVAGYFVVSKFDKFLNENSKNKRRARKNEDSEHTDKK